MQQMATGGIEPIVPAAKDKASVHGAPALQTEPQKEPILNKLKCGISMCLPRQCCIDVPLLICLPATDHKPEFKKDCAYCI